MAIHECGQMYLETIYILSQDSAFVRAIDVGEQLGFTKPSVSRAMSILKKDGYVNVDADGAGCGRKDCDRGCLPDRACNQREILCGGAGALGAGNENAGGCARAMSLCKFGGLCYRAATRYVNTCHLQRISNEVAP